MPGIPLRERRQRAAGLAAHHIRSIGRRLTLRPASGAPATAASRTIGTSNAAVTYSLPVWRGASGNTWRVAHVVAGNNTPFSIVVSGRDVTVNSATNGSAVATTTAAQAAAAVNANTALSDVGFRAVAGGTGASVIVAGALANLTGGVGA